MTILPARRLGTLEVSAVSLGCMNLSHAYGVPPSEEESARLLNRAIDLGVTMLDTAALYGGGRNEQLLAKAVMHRRHEFMLASKCVLEMRDGKRLLDGSPAAITRMLNEALIRLGTDHIDLYYLHRLDQRVSIEESVGALSRAVEAGKVGAIGLSEMSGPTIARAHAVHAIAAVQTEYSPLSRNPEVAVLETCRRLGIGFVAFSPLARGLLADGVRDDRYAPGDIRAQMPRFVGERLAHNLKAVDRFNRLAATLSLTPAQLALGWVLAMGEHVVAIPGSTRIDHLEQNLRAANLRLDAGTLASIEEIFGPGAIIGARYSAAAQRQVGTELLPGEELEAA